MRVLARLCILDLEDTIPEVDGAVALTANAIVPIHGLGTKRSRLLTYPKAGTLNLELWTSPLLIVTAQS